MLVVSVGGSPSLRSRSGVLLERSRDWLQERGVEVVTFQVREFPAEDLLHARFDSPQVRHFNELVAQADGLVVATPVYKASFAGALKTLLDLLPERALEHKVVLPIATGGSIAHMLAVDYALKPVLSALKAQETLQGIFADDSQIAYGEGARPAQLAAALEQRLQDSLETFHSALARRPRPVVPGELNERLISARWSI
ncbi:MULTISPECIES: NADPH-dependent FMN reductase [unclassified Pseudomonas]|uniref:NADPH-dependent FMN reductase n=1 Tax=unclassified Pseudomonas TaxID=196821 RepID=UPI001943D4C8|nr:MULTISPECIES: NADPH-dependent FMN reductase [unclassified Pseudomonas]MDC0685971.1 NADPH-dependent FMN reductase [Mitsuaria sp. RG]MCE0913766.1 NADPH-dependent FMN reductase [Pseudomonas sp. NMI760_13]MCP8635615.1 NADPH-dependent FMN reductase [Pseudomonas sp. DVZ6]MDD7786115.1 NADPH-dependent FMN reductase [Pseudomonas sp. DVZ24]BCJ04599.1 NAD(P)H-dependent FMN reductase [Pseudomonas sp. RtIB026]